MVIRGNFSRNQYLDNFVSYVGIPIYNFILYVGIPIYYVRIPIYDANFLYIVISRKIAPDDHIVLMNNFVVLSFF